MNEEQQRICARYEIGFQQTSNDEIIGVTDNVLTGVQPINGLRHIPESGAAGWYIWAGETFSDAPDFFKPMHVKHFMDEHPKLAKYLGLAPGGRFLVDLDSGHEDIWFDEELLQPGKNNHD